MACIANPHTVLYSIVLSYSLQLGLTVGRMGRMPMGSMATARMPMGRATHL